MAKGEFPLLSQSRFGLRAFAIAVAGGVVTGILVYGLPIVMGVASPAYWIVFVVVYAGVGFVIGMVAGASMLVILIANAQRDSDVVRLIALGAAGLIFGAAWAWVVSSQFAATVVPSAFAACTGVALMALAWAWTWRVQQQRSHDRGAST